MSEQIPQIALSSEVSPSRSMHHCPFSFFPSGQLSCRQQTAILLLSQKLRASATGQAQNSPCRLNSKELALGNGKEDPTGTAVLGFGFRSCAHTSHCKGRACYVRRSQMGGGEHSFPALSLFTVAKYPYHLLLLLIALLWQPRENRKPLPCKAGFLPHPLKLRLQETDLPH